MSEMIERAARALCLAEHFEDADAPVMVGMKTMKAWESRVSRVRAVMEEMLNTDVGCRVNGEIAHEIRGAPNDIWKSIITSFLTPTETEKRA